MKYYVVDAFTDEVFRGNPAGVCVIDSQTWPEDETLRLIAAENNLPETAFIMSAEDGYHLRYFSPVYEVPLCGHATMGSSFVINHFLNPEAKKILCHTKSGDLVITTQTNGYQMDLPVRNVKSITTHPDIEKAIGCRVMESYIWERDVFAVIESEMYLKEMVMDFSMLNTVPNLFNCCVSAKGSGDFDFVSRLFSPNYAIPEDPVCGSAHCALTPLWAAKLHKNELKAHQVSPRGGVLRCKMDGERVLITGNATLYMDGQIHI